jgi:PIN domain nuclease of toxin-antitoxin system
VAELSARSRIKRGDIRAVADTHAVIWYLFDDRRLSSPARAVFEEAAADGDAVVVTTLTIVEIVYLVERGRIPPSARQRLLDEIISGWVVLLVYPLDREIALTVPQVDRSVVPDLPDRIIAATALHLGVPLLTRDERVRMSGVPTIW